MKTHLGSSPSVAKYFSHHCFTLCSLLLIHQSCSLEYSENTWLKSWWSPHLARSPAATILLDRQDPPVFLAATKQLYECYFLSVCPSVCPFWLCFHHHIITKFSEVITNDRSDVHAKGQGHRSKVKVTEVIIQLSRFQTVTPVWIHIWWWNDA